jgi:hypothetical protein
MRHLQSNRINGAKKQRDMSGPHPFSDRCRHGSKRAKIRKETGI